MENLSRWMSALAAAVVETLIEFQSADGTRCSIVAVDLGCYPWHGTLELSILTEEEADRTPELVDPSEAAAWKHYNFAKDLPAWKSGDRIAA